ncbi:MAG: WxcM-like domain-containing protein [Clostridia bacterium]|nr:WxcM-like domain-containing protein [Clostridia bacterium]
MENTCRILHFDTFQDQRGKLSVVEGGQSIPFEIKRAFFLYDLPAGAVRGGHAGDFSEVIVTMAGQCKISAHDGLHEQLYVLAQPMTGLYIPRLFWREIFDFSENCVLAVLSDAHYNADAYIKDFDEFMQKIRKGSV